MDALRAADRELMTMDAIASRIIDAEGFTQATRRYGRRSANGALPRSGHSGNKGQPIRSGSDAGQGATAERRWFRPILGAL